MSLMQYLEIFTLITGIIYVILEILQKNSMWILGFFTALAAAIVFFSEKLYASSGLNAYYVIMSVIGYYTWYKDSQKLKSRQREESLQTQQGHTDWSEIKKSDAKIHLNKISNKVLVYSAIALVAGTIALYYILRYLGDPMGLLDAYVTILSALATVWLVKSYIAQWLLWVIADILSATLCLAQGMPWMGTLYFLYALSAIYGYIYWKRHGVNVD